MSQLDTEELPVFVARNLYKLPPVTFDHVDVTRLLKDIVILQQEMIDIKQSYARKEELCSLKTDFADLKIEANKNESEGSVKYMDACDSDCVLLSTVDEKIAAKSPRHNQSTSVVESLIENAISLPENKVLSDRVSEGSSKTKSQSNVEMVIVKLYFSPMPVAAQVQNMTSTRGDNVNNVDHHPKILCSNCK